MDACRPAGSGVGPRLVGNQTVPAAYSSNAAGSAYEIWTMRDDGSNARRLAAFDGSCCGTPYWAPDGSRVAVSQLNGMSIVNVSSGDDTLVISSGGGCTVKIAGWSAHGDALYVYPACSSGI